MKYAALPVNEKRRLQTLEKLQLFQSGPEENYDNITKLASMITGTPVSLVTLIGEKIQTFKSKIGTELTQAPREISHCTHAILNPEDLMEVPDTREDERFSDNPYTTGTPEILFYAGMPLKAYNGDVLGTLCVLDVKPKILNQEQKDAIKALAKQVENLFELRRHNLELEKTTVELKEKNSQLKNFAGIVSHDMKMPLANMIITTDLIKAKYASNFDEEGIQYLNYLKQSSFKLSNYITGILQHYESDSLFDSNTEEFDIHDLLENIIDLLNINYNCVINLPEENIILNCNKIALQQIFLNLIGNSLKYNNKEEIIIDVLCSNGGDFYNFSISDNGIGIPKDKQQEIFDLFTIVEEIDRSGNRGNGIGLSTVKKLVNSFGGEITVESEINHGTTFKFTMNKSHCN